MTQVWDSSNIVVELVRADGIEPVVLDDEIENVVAVVGLDWTDTGHLNLNFHMRTHEFQQVEDETQQQLQRLLVAGSSEFDGYR